jgi:ribonuclease D
LQVSTGQSIFLFDALRLRSLAPLGPLLGRPNLLWILHAGLQDVRLLERELEGPAPRRLLDTQVGWALLGPEYSVSLAYLEYKVCGIRADKGHQADDWVRRPIPRSQLDYAAQDVAHLPAIFSRIRERLLTLQRFDIAIAASLATLTPEPEAPRPLSIAGFRNAWQLSPEGLAALALLIDFHNGLSAHDQGVVGEPKVLMSLAARLPGSKDDLVRIKGVSRSLAERYGERILTLLRTARQSGIAAAPALDPPAYGSFEEHRLDAWLTTLRAEVCALVSVAPELALPSRQTRRMLDGYGSGGIPALLASLTGWRKSLLHAEVERFCERQPPPV